MIPTYKNAQELLEYSKHHEVQIIENSDKMLVLTDVANGVRAHAYHQAADNHGMGATAPCLVIRGERELMIYAPRAKAERVRVTVYDELEISECPEELDIDIRDGRTEFNFTTSESEEKAFYVKYITITSDMFYRVNYTKEHEKRFAQLSAAGLVSLFLHCKTAMVGGKTVPISPDNPRLQTVMKNGVMLAPVSFLSNITV